MTEDHENQYNEAWIQNELETKGILKAPEEGAVLFADDLVNAWKNFNQTNSNIGLIINGWVIDRTHAFYNQKFSSTTFLNCKFIGTLHMLGTYFNQLKFHNCFFSVVELSHAKIDGVLEFLNPKSLNLDNLVFHFEGTHVKQNIKIKLDQDWNLTHINLEHAKVDGDFKLDGDINVTPESSFSIIAKNSEVSKDFTLILRSKPDNDNLEGEISLKSAKIGGSCKVNLICNFAGHVNLEYLTSDTLDLILQKIDETILASENDLYRAGIGLNLRRSQIIKHFYLSFGEIKATNIGIDLSSSSIGGEVSILGIPKSNSTISGNDYSLRFDSLDAKHDIRVRGLNNVPISLNGNLSFLNAIIQNSLIFRSVRIQGKSFFDSVHVVKKSIFENCEISDGFSARRARFDQELHFKKFIVHNSSLDMMDATVLGELKLSEVTVGSESSSGSEIYFEKIHVGHDLWIESNSKIFGRLVLENSEIKNLLHIEDTFIGGSLDLRYSTICSKFEIHNIEIHHKTSDVAVEAKGLNVKGDASFTDVNTINGTVDFSSAKFDNDFNIKSISLNKLLMIRVEVLGELLVRDFITQSESSSANLEQAHVGILNDTPSSWRGFSSIILGTFSFDALARATLNSWGDIENRIEWIERRSKESSVTSFNYEPYEYLAKSLIVLGRESDVREVVYAKEKALAQFERSNSRGKIRGFFKGIGSFVLKWVTGYGQKPIRLFAALFVTYCLSFTVVVIAKSNNLMAPISPLIANHHVVKANECTTYYPCISDVLYPLEATLPVLDLHQSGLWEISSETSLGSALSLIFGLLTLSGWGISLLAVASLTGIIDRKKI